MVNMVTVVNSLINIEFELIFSNFIKNSNPQTNQSRDIVL